VGERVSEGVSRMSEPDVPVRDHV